MGSGSLLVTHMLALARIKLSNLNDDLYFYTAPIPTVYNTNLPCTSKCVFVNIPHLQGLQTGFCLHTEPGCDKVLVQSTVSTSASSSAARTGPS